jgi:hypothetical protein
MKPDLISSRIWNLYFYMYCFCLSRVNCVDVCVILFVNRVLDLTVSSKERSSFLQ